MTAPINNRYEFVLLYDVENGNPNGDPDAGQYAADRSRNRLWHRDRCLPEAQNPQLCRIG